MVIDAREPQILKRSSAQRLHQPNMGDSRSDFAAGELFEEQLQLECVHRSEAFSYLAPTYARSRLQFF